MLRENVSVEDLKNEVLNLKKRYSSIQNENHLLKVKVRKLQDELSKKDKHIEVLLNPKKSNNLRKFISENSAALVLNLQDENERLKKILEEKNSLIRRLQNDLQTAKLYNNINIYQQHDKKKPNNNALTAQTEIDVELKPKEMSISIPYHAENGLETNRLQENLERIKSAFSSEENSPKNNSEPSRGETCQTPHEEIQQLQTYVLDVLNEMSQLKTTINHLESKQNMTDHALKQKQNDLIALKGKLEELKKSKSETSVVSKSSSTNVFVKRKNKFVTKSNRSESDKDSSGGKNIRVQSGKSKRNGVKEQKEVSVYESTGVLVFTDLDFSDDCDFESERID